MKRIGLKDYERGLEARKAARGFAGFDFVRPNSGATRTPEKRILLRKLADIARRQSRKPRFKANF